MPPHGAERDSRSKGTLALPGRPGSAPPRGAQHPGNQQAVLSEGRPGSAGPCCPLQKLSAPAPHWLCPSALGLLDPLPCWPSCRAWEPGLQGACSPPQSRGCSWAPAPLPKGAPGAGLSEAGRTPYLVCCPFLHTETWLTPPPPLPGPPATRHVSPRPLSSPCCVTGPWPQPLSCPRGCVHRTGSADFTPRKSPHSVSLKSPPMPFALALISLPFFPVFGLNSRTQS